MNRNVKLLSLILTAALFVGVFIGCKKKEASPDVDFTLASDSDIEPDIEPDEKLKEPEASVENKEPTDKYKIYVNFKTQVVSVRSKDGSGNFTVRVRDFICSTGAGDKTPSGNFKLQTKYRWQILKGDVYGQWCSQITGNILFHSVPYSRKDPSSLITKYYNQLGGKASAGCIRLRAVDAKWIYDNCSGGTAVEMGSLAYPHLPGATSNQKLPAGTGWDPSDPTPGNPVYGKTFEPQTTTTAPIVTTAAPTTAAPTTKAPTTTQKSTSVVPTTETGTSTTKQ